MRMAATTRRNLILVRHGQSESNLVGHSKSIFDPNLTPKGETDARNLRQWLEQSYSPLPTLVITSTLSRTLQTSSIAFADLVDPLAISPNPSQATDTDSRNSSQQQQHEGEAEGSSVFVPIIATDVVREIVGGSCIAEIRRPIAELKSQYNSVDFRVVEKNNDDPMRALAVNEAGEEGPGERLVELRVRNNNLVDLLWSLPWTARFETIAVVSHYYFLNKFLEELLGTECDAYLTVANYVKKWPTGHALIFSLENPATASDDGGAGAAANATDLIETITSSFNVVDPPRGSVTFVKAMMTSS